MGAGEHPLPQSTQEIAEAYRVADGRLAALKASRAHVDTTVDDLLDEIAHLDDEPVEVQGIRWEPCSVSWTVDLSGFAVAMDKLNASWIQLAATAGLTAKAFQLAVDALCKHDDRCKPPADRPSTSTEARVRAALKAYEEER